VWLQNLGPRPHPVRRLHLSLPAEHCRWVKHFAASELSSSHNVCETWVPLGPHRLGSRPSPTSGSGLLEDLPTYQWAHPILIGSPHDLLKTFHKIPQTTSFGTTSRLGVQDKTLVDFDQSRSTGYGKSCNQLDLGFPIVTDLDFGPPTLSVAQYKAGKGVLPGTTNIYNQQTIDRSPCNLATPAIQPKNWT
jgi:hypothetical protein